MSVPAPKWSPEAEALLREARRLPDDERLRLADELRSGVPDDVTAAWDEEILQRAEAFERGDLKGVDGREVFARIEAKYGR